MRTLVSGRLLIGILAFAALLLPALRSTRGQQAAVATERMQLSGLAQPVEVIRDRWGVPHIYAETVDDLFFAQGFVVAQDRLWQMEMWRLNGEGRLAEVLGERALERDVYARQVRYRGDMQAEWTSYAPDARQIITAFVRGINAYIEHASSNNDLPVEFGIMGFRPQPWTPEVCLTRMAGYIMSRNVASEVTLAMLARRLGPERAIELWLPDPNTKIRAEPGSDFSAITPAILAGHRAASGSLNLRGESRSDEAAAGLGSNNWTLAGSRTASGRPILANDPHRPLLLPSLRYMAHLVGPGWNVIGAGEPTLPGIAVGHNERIAYGMTIFQADQQDLYIEKTDPANPRRYLYRGAWEPMRVEKERFLVKGAATVERDLLFTRHGPVIHEDRARRLAFALRWVGLEPGSAGYLASLSAIRARNWEEFQSALRRWKIPSLNMVYADVDGNIGYQVAGLAPARDRWNGLVPVPGDSGRYEWRGYRSLEQLPRAFNPQGGFVATANHKTIAAGGPIPPVGYEWAAPYRFRRIEQVLSGARGLTIADNERLQHDVVSLPAQKLTAMLGDATANGRLGEAVALLRKWDHALSPDSAAAALYEIWAQKLAPKVIQPLVPADLWSTYAQRGSLHDALTFLERGNPSAGVPPAPAARRQEILLEALAEAERELAQKIGSDMKRWRWGDLHKAEFRHPLLDKFNLGPVERGGDGLTVNNTNYARSTYRQLTGASYRQIFDVGDWDNSVGINVPGQSGRPGSRHYADLLPLWAAGRYHPLPYSRKAVEQHAASRLLLEPRR